MNKDRVLVVYLSGMSRKPGGDLLPGVSGNCTINRSFVLTKAENGVKGSGRWIEAYSMYEELVKCRDLLTQFGGHPMAAGLSMAEENIERFRKRLNENCTLSEDDLMPTVMIDVPMPISYLTETLTERTQSSGTVWKGKYKTVVCSEKSARFKIENLWEKQKCCQNDIDRCRWQSGKMRVFFGEVR